MNTPCHQARGVVVVPVSGGKEPRMTTSELPAGVQRVSDELARRAPGRTVTMLADSARTAADAAAALGCGVGEIAKTIVFRRVADDAAVVVILSGDHRVDTARLTVIAGELGKANADFVRERTGFVIGGVSPLGHAEQSVLVLDVGLDRFDTVWAAAGHPHAVFDTSYSELAAWTGAALVDVAER